MRAGIISNESPIGKALLGKRVGENVKVNSPGGSYEVIFAQWDPVRAAFGSYGFGALRRLVLDIQGPKVLFGLANPFYYNPYLGFFLQMIPYAFTILILVLGSREAFRKRLGAPAALGTPYVRGARGL